MHLGRYAPDVRAQCWYLGSEDGDRASHYLWIDLERLRTLLGDSLTTFPVAADIKRKSEAGVLSDHSFDRFLKRQFGTFLQRQAENTLRTSFLWCHSG
jgi:hypothetical protein